ncbi:MAG: hypothetical protein WBN60_11690, partial [Polyangiales bacterium]
MSHRPSTTSRFRPSLALLGILGFTLSACSRVESHAAAEPAPLLVETMEVAELSDYEVRRVFSGIVRSGRASQLGFERPGTVAKVFVD